MTDSDAPKQVEALEADRDGVRTKMVDGLYHVMDRKHVEALRRAVHASVDSLFDSLEYSDQGIATNNIEYNLNREFTRWGLAGDRQGFLVESTTLSVKVGETIAGLQRQIDDLRKRENVK